MKKSPLPSNVECGALAHNGAAEFTERTEVPKILGGLNLVEHPYVSEFIARFLNR